MTSFSEKVNAVSGVLSSLTNDPAERYGIAQAVAEVNRHALGMSFTVINPGDASAGAGAPVPEAKNG